MTMEFIYCDNGGKTTVIDTGIEFCTVWDIKKYIEIIYSEHLCRKIDELYAR